MTTLRERNDWNRKIRDLVDSLLQQAGYTEDSSARNHLGMMNFDAQPESEPAATHKTTGWMAPVDRYAVPVLFSPYTGEPRDVRDVQSDPQGILIVPPGKVEMLAAKPTCKQSLQVESEPSDRADLIAKLRADFNEDRVDFDNIKAAANMLEAVANLATNFAQVTAHRDHCLAVVDKLRAQQVEVPQGYALVPIVPTLEMSVAGKDAELFAPSARSAAIVYRAMLKAAPQQGKT